VEAIRLEQNSFRIKQLERATTQVISWWWEYQRNEYDSTLISFWVENDGSEIHIRGTQPGTTYPSIKDQYNQTATIEVIVEDLNLELTKYEFQLNPGQEEIVYFMEYYSDIVSLVKNNENAKIYLDQDEQGKYLRIEWIEEWITIFQVTDVEWNSKTGKITVWPGSVTEPENPGEPVDPEPVPLPEEPLTDEEEELEEFLRQLLEDIDWIQINASENEEIENLWKQLPQEITDRIDNYIEQNRDRYSISSITSLIPAFKNKEEQHVWLKLKLFKYVRLSFEILKIEKEVEAQIQDELLETKRELIRLERQLLELNVQLIELKTQYDQNNWWKEWLEQAIEDYIVWYVEFMDISEIPALIRGIANIRLDDITESISELYQIYVNLEEILVWLSDEEKAYYESYVKVTLKLAAIPVKLDKVNKFKGKWDSEVYKKLAGLLKKWKVKVLLDDVEVKKTLERIEKWEGKYDQDWLPFENRPPRWQDESMLPVKSDWEYYKEWTVDTPWETYRGQRRIVTWKGGEKYYTDDHYYNFIKIN